MKRCVARGKQEGRQEGLQEALLLTLEVRFENISDDIRDKVNQIEDRSLLMRLHRAAVQVVTIEEFRSLLAS